MHRGAVADLIAYRGANHPDGKAPARHSAPPLRRPTVTLDTLPAWAGVSRRVGERRRAAAARGRQPRRGGTDRRAMRRPTADDGRPHPEGGGGQNPGPGQRGDSEGGGVQSPGPGEQPDSEGGGVQNPRHEGSPDSEGGG